AGKGKEDWCRGRRRWRAPRGGGEGRGGGGGGGFGPHRRLHRAGDGELDAFNAKRSGAEWPAGVADEDSLKLKELTEKTSDAAKVVRDLAANALARAQKAEAGAKQRATEAAAEVAAFYARGQGRLKESKDVGQKAGWLLDYAKAK
ncbi:unnamed protein product, partial [Prorocentrum cordatum]